MADNFSVGICGSVNNPNKKYDPMVYCRSEKGKALLYELASKSKNKKNIEADLLEGLMLVEAIRIVGDKCYINFPIFLNEDKRIIEKVVEKYAIKLASQICGKRKKLFKLSNELKYASVGAEKNLFLIIGCACLDWRCLDLFAKHDYLIFSPQKAGGNEYTLWGQEKKQGSLKEIYWGSHNKECGAYTFTTFGDHENIKRNAFPDIFWNMIWDRQKTFSNEFENELYAAFTENLDIWGEKIAKELLNYSPNTKNHIINLLKRLSYIKNDTINIPVFTETDARPVQEIESLIDELALQWAKENYDKLKNDLSEINPNKQGVDYKDTFSQIWHYVFGYTNKFLSREGLIFNPYCKDSDFRGYLPAVHVNNLGL
ncbi:MAG: hypothetical protein L6420_08360 [Elusimicrobia bacterium]|nr:hypothetical protein [Elusimicrobiota bacterium]